MPSQVAFDRDLAGTGAGSTWSLEEIPNAFVANGRLSADACSSPTWCVAVGTFNDRSGTSPLAETWNGTAWSIEAIPVPANATDGALDGVACSSSSDCVAVGNYTDGLNVQIGLAEAWNGVSWVIQPTPDPAGAIRTYLESVSCGSPASCSAVGYWVEKGSANVAFAEGWNGTSWNLEKTARPAGDSGATLDGVSCSTGTTCAAVGSYLDYSSDEWVTLAEDWNGSSWSVQTTPNRSRSIVSSLHGVSCSSPTACMAVGDFVNGSSSHSRLLAETFAEMWNGATWTIVTSPNPPGSTDIDSLQGVSCTSPTSCSAVGYYTGPSGAADTAFAESWNGHKWSVASTPNPGRSDRFLYGVSCSMSVSCVAVGQYRNAARTPVALAETSNGTTWSVRPTPIPSGAAPTALSSVSCSSTWACMAVGSYANSPDTRLTLAEAWDGTTWSVQHTPNRRHFTQNILTSVSCISPTSCTAIGESYNGRSDSLLADAWNGTNWDTQAIPSPPGGGELSAVSCASAVACTAVGYYSNSAGLAVTLAEGWNGTNWTIENTPNPSNGVNDILDGVSCNSPTACTAVGNYTSSASLVALVEAWNGTTWSIQKTPGGDDDLYGVSCASATACTAVGDTYAYPSGISPLAEAWNGTDWAVESTPPIESSFSSLYGVVCYAASKCTAVGGYDDSSGIAVTLAEAWNGTTWKIQTSPNPRGGTNSVLDSVSGGSASMSGGSASTLIAVGSHLDRAQVPTALAEIRSGR